MKACRSIVITFFGVCLFTLPAINSNGQDQRVADSLVRYYQEGKFVGVTKLELLRQLAFNETNDYKLSLRYADELINLSVSENNFLYLFRGYRQKGAVNRQLGNFEIALEAFFMSREAASKAGYKEGEGSAYTAIADTYSEMGNSHNAENYYNKSISLLRTTEDTVSLATALINAGDEYFKNRKYDSAMLYFNESGLLFRKINYLIGTAYTLGNIGMVYAVQGKDELAKANISEAIAILEQHKNYIAISEYLTYMSDIYLKQKDWPTSLSYAQRSLQLAQKFELKKQISDSNLKLSVLYEQLGKPSESLRFYKEHIAYRDSVNNLETVQQMADLRTDFEVSQKQVEVDLLNQQKKNQRIVLVASTIATVLVLLLALGLYRRYHFIKVTNRVIEEEKNRSDKLLLNILPDETAQELKHYGKVKAKKFESVTVMFTDFKDFTRFSERVDPDQLIRSIDFYFREFDMIISKYGLEKIKTIGDSYMCAGGLPVPNPLHAVKVVQAAREMIELVRRKLMEKDDLLHFQVRIGIHTGPVVAGIVGMKKWQYDIWGDTVNIASRLESASEPGRINLSESTYKEIKEQFPCSYRGELEAKNRGALKMYYLG